MIPEYHPNRNISLLADLLHEVICWTDGRALPQRQLPIEIVVETPDINLCAFEDKGRGRGYL